MKIQKKNWIVGFWHIARTIYIESHKSEIISRQARREGWKEKQVGTASESSFAWEVVVRIFSC